MQITFDHAENNRNIAQRGLSFELVAAFDWNMAVILPDLREENRTGQWRVLAVISDTMYSAIIRNRDGKMHVCALRKSKQGRGGRLPVGEEYRAYRADDTNPAWTWHEIRSGRPALDVIAEVFGPIKAVSPPPRRGRPPEPKKKISTTLRIDADVLAAYQREGSDWRARVNQVLREHMPENEEGID